MPDTSLTNRKVVVVPPPSVDLGGVTAPHSVEGLRHAVHRARAALAGLLEAANVDSTKTRETARLLNINRGLVWRLSRVVCAQDDVTAATHLPGSLGLDRLIEACRSRGVGEDLLDAARAAVNDFHETVDRSLGDRRTLEIILANAGADSTSADLEGARRSMFEGGCAVWGVRADVRVRAMFVVPSKDDPMMVDQADVAGYAGFRRLRQVAWPMSYRAYYPDEGGPESPAEESIDKSEQGRDVLLMREFCTPRDLMIQTVHSRGVTRHELPSGPTGGNGITCMFGAIMRHISPARLSDSGEVLGSLLVLDTPVERVLMDTFVHRSLGIPGAPSVRLLDRLTRQHGYHPDAIEVETLPIALSARRLGPGAGGTVTPHIPWYPRMVEQVCGRLGHAPEEFVAHRVEIAYPPIPTALLATFPLPE